MKRIPFIGLLIVAIVMFLSSCISTEEPEGIVTFKQYLPGDLYIPTCWELEIDNDERICVTKEVYYRINIGDYYKEVT